MRWILIICVLLAIVTDVLAEKRIKRTVPFIDTLTLLGVPQKQAENENILLYKIPGYDDILLKVTPKNILKKEAVPIQIALATNSIKVENAGPQNKTCDDAPSAFQKMVDLIKVGIHNKKRFLGKLFGPAPITPIIVINEELKYPVIQEVQKPPPPVVGVKYTETVEVDTKKMAVPVPKIVTRPKQVVTQVVQPTYSYKQASKGGTVMSYDFEDNPNVIVTESVAMPALPPYIKSRFEEIVSVVNPIAPLAIQPGLMRVPGAVITEDISFGSPIIPEVLTPIPPVPAPIYPPAYARLQGMGYLEGEDFYGPPILVEEDIPVLLRSQTNIIKMPGSKGDVNVKITTNKRPVSINSENNSEAEPIKVNLGTNISSGSLSPTVGISKTIPPPPPNLSNINTNSGSKSKLPAQSTINQRSINNVINKVSGNNEINSDEKDTSFIYKQVSNKDMQPLHISQAAPNTKNYFENNSEEIDDISSRMKDYYYVPPVGNVEPSPINAQSTSVQPQKIQVSNLGSLSPCLENNQVTISSNCLDQYFVRNDDSLKSSPIVVSDSPPFLYQQVNADGSSMSMIRDQNNVIVDVKEGRTPQDNRGDIPQGSLY